MIAGERYADFVEENMVEVTRIGLSLMVTNPIFLSIYVLANMIGHIRELTIVPRQLPCHGP